MSFILILVIIGAAAGAVAVWSRSKEIAVKWYEWLIGAIGLFLLLFALQNLVGTLSELYTQPAWMMLIAIGLPALILLTIAWQLVWRRNRAAG